MDVAGVASRLVITHYGPEAARVVFWWAMAQVFLPFPFGKAPRRLELQPMFPARGAHL
jgi:hypothetical protein